jgi:hypothetical protein
MRLKKGIEKQEKGVEAERKGYFRTSFSVMADTFKDIYGIQQRKDDLPKQAPHMVLPDQKPSEPVLTEAEEQDHPVFRKWAGRIAKYAYWFGLSRLANSLGAVIGQSIAFTAIIYHPFFVSSSIRLARSRIEEKAGEIEATKHDEPKKLVDGIRSTLKRLGSVLVPDRATQVLTFCLLELITTPIFISVIDAVAKTSEGVVSPIKAALGVILGTGAALVLEYIGYRTAWKNAVLRDIDKGSIKDDLKGVIGEFKPLRLFGLHKETKPADNASEYVGQIYGVIESYWIWIQAGRVAVAAGLAGVFDLTPAGFIGAYLGALMSWYGFAVDAVLPMYIEAMKQKLRENNKHLDIEGER